MPADPHSFGARLIRRSVRFLVQCYYRRVEISDQDRIPHQGPVLLCANHPNSLMDPVLVGVAAGRPVRFMAKAPLFKTPVMGPAMFALGMIPAYRGQDDARQVHRNTASLDEGAKILLAGGAMGIFPEGKSHDETSLEMVRSGASRMAQQAASDGVTGIHLVPVGLNLEHKERFQSDVWIRIGDPIDFDTWVAEIGEDDPKRIQRKLTEELGRRLKAVVLHLDDTELEPWLDDLEVLLPVTSGSSKIEPLRLRKRVADAINHFYATDQPRAEKVAADMSHYHKAVAAAGLSVDAPVLTKKGFALAGHLLWGTLWLLLFLLPAAAGLLFHLLPFGIARLAAARVTPEGRTAISFYRLIVSLPVYLAWYAVTAWWLWDQWPAAAIVSLLCLMPLCGLIAMEYWRRSKSAVRVLWQQFVALTRPAILRDLLQQQAPLRETLGTLAAEYAQLKP